MARETYCYSSASSKCVVLVCFEVKFQFHFVFPGQAYVTSSVHYKAPKYIKKKERKKNDHIWSLDENV